MNNWTEESGLGDCLICFNKIENYNVQLPGQEYQKIADNCWNYLHENIANSKLQNVKSENENELPLCKKCFDAASELMELSGVVSKTGKKISNLSFEFSLGVLARRTQVESVNNIPHGQNSPKDFILLDVSRISRSLFSTDQPNKTKIDDVEHPCDDNFVGMGAEIKGERLHQTLEANWKRSSKMNNLTEEPGLGDCIICFSKFENYPLLPGQEYQKIVDSCWNHLYENITDGKLQNVKSDNGNELPLCKKCFDAAFELMELSEVVIKSEKKISNLSFEFSLGVLARGTQVQSVNNLLDGQNSPKELIVLDVSGISPSLFSKDQTNPTEIDDFAHPCENNLVGIDAALNDPQALLEIVYHESEEAVDDESAESEDDTNITKDEEVPVPLTARQWMVLEQITEAKVSKKFNTNTSAQHPDVTNRKHELRNESWKKVGQSSSSNISHRKTGTGNLKKVKQSVSSLEVGGRSENGKQEYKCNICEIVCARPSDLKRHTRVHTGERPYKCSFCAKSFPQMSHIRRHERIHTGEKPFKCSFCMKAFNQLTTLQSHERIHTGEKPFKCSFCMKAFRKSSDKRRHEKIHIGETM